jgi:tetratricopeptide (TPR) repeat protein
MTLDTPIEKSEMLFNEGIYFYENEMFKEAEEKFLSSLELNPHSEEILYNLALVYFEMKEFDKSWFCVDQISEIDCTELITELEKLEPVQEYSIPESIPEHCGLCENFDNSSLINNEIGFCHFYKLKMSMNSRCFAYKLADEGRVPLEIIEQKYNKRLKDQLAYFQGSLIKDELPGTVKCSACETELQLSETERALKRYVCPNCNEKDDIGEKIKSLKEKLHTAADIELYKIILDSNDYKIEYLYAARNEIHRRNIDLAGDDDFVSMLRNRKISVKLI